MSEQNMWRELGSLRDKHKRLEAKAVRLKRHVDKIEAEAGMLRNALSAQIEAGRALAEAVRSYYTASVDGVVGVQAEDAMRSALAVWDCAAGEGGAK